MLAEHSVISEEQHYRCRNGHDITCRVTACRVGDCSADKLIAVTYEDMTNRKQEEETLARSQEKMAILVQERTRELQHACDDLAHEMMLHQQAAESCKRAERCLADVIDFLPDATSAVDLEGRIIIWNQAIEDMTGVKVDEMLGRGDYTYALPFYGEHRPIAIDWILNPDLAIPDQYRFVKKDGEAILIETDFLFLRGRKCILWAKISPLYDSKGRKIGAIESIRDITQQKQMERQLLQAQKMEAIGTLSGGIAHDFNNLLMSVKGHVSLMMMDMHPSHTHYEKLRLIQHHVQSGADLTRQLLGFARGERFQVRPTDINKLIRKILNMFGRTMKKIRIHK